MSITDIEQSVFRILQGNNPSTVVQSLIEAINTSGMVCDFCGKVPVTHFYTTNPFMISGRVRTQFATCKNCHKIIESKNAGKLTNQAIKMLPMKARSKARKHFSELFSKFLSNIITSKKLEAGDLFDLHTARASAKEAKCELNTGHPTLGECTKLALLVVDGKKSCMVCAAAYLGEQDITGIIGHPRVKDLP